MSSKLAALRARIKEKDNAGKEKVKESIAASNKDWESSQAKDREVLKELALEQKKRAQEEAAATPAKKQKTDEDQTSPTLCYCKKEARAGKVLKEGPNQGKSYVSCTDRTCKFFKFTTEAVAAQPPPSAAQPPPEEEAAAAKEPAKEPTHCRCGDALVSKTVTATGTNCGRNFWACVKGKKDFGGCGYFAWHAATEPPPEDAANPAPVPNCKCKVPVVTKKISIMGPNFGRLYASCAKGKEEFGGCGYYVWKTFKDDAATPAKPAELSTTKCRCPGGVFAERKVVVKDGANKNRAYITCKSGKKEFGGCGFFEWVDPAAEAPTPLRTGTAGGDKNMPPATNMFKKGR